MKKIILISIFFFLFFALFYKISWAIYNPLSLPNNKFGIHIADLNDIDEAENLANSTGGDWGYVTFIIQDGDQNLEKWQKFFKELNKRHLVPLVRIATHLKGNFWVKPKREDAKKWAKFLNQLPWPIKNRYVIVYNEPNHAKEWGRELDPASYAKILDETIKALKKENEDFFVLNAGFDLAAPNGRNTMDVRDFWKKMDKTIPGIFKKIDGWASHSYPNPAFSGSPYDNGRTSIKGYQWELEYLKENFGVESLPVFITETGWTHNGWQKNRGLNPETVTNYFETAFNEIWQDKRIVAITPFLLNYQNFPFSSFSWKIPGKDEFYPQFSTVQSMKKSYGFPIKEDLTGFGEILVKKFEKKKVLSYNKQ